MNQQSIHLRYDPNRLLDNLMERLEISCDQALSRRLKIAMQVISNIRSGYLPIRASMLLWFSESTGASIDELRRVLGDRRAKFRLHCGLGVA
jgi:hypothetical protein